MPALKPTPKDTALYVSGTGIWITKSVVGADNAPGDPELVARYTVHDPALTSDRDVGYPTYQFRMVKNFNVGAGTTEPSHATLLHCHIIQKILVVPVFLDGDVSASLTWMDTYADVSAIPILGTAMAAIPVPDPVGVTEIATTVISIPTVADKLGVEVFSRTKTGHVAPAAPAITGVALGFSGAELTDWVWRGLVAERDPDDVDLINVLGGLVKTGARAGGIGDLSTTANYRFTVRESTGVLVSAAELAATDVAFVPNQLVSGTPIGIVGGGVKTWWCIGRADPEFYDPVLDPSHRPASSPKIGGVAAAGPIGVWATQDPTWKTWIRLSQIPTGVSHNQVQHLDHAAVPHQEAPRDVGLSYLPVQQLLTPHTIDTDAGQDPVVETGKYTIEDPPPP